MCIGVHFLCSLHPLSSMFWLHCFVFPLLCQTLMLVSSTTRPLLGCVWNFPTSYSGLAYATTSMVIHETIPIILMALTNLASLYMLYTHGRMRSSVQDAPVIKRVPAERRAAKVRKRRVVESLWLYRDTYWRHAHRVDEKWMGGLKCFVSSRP